MRIRSILPAAGVGLLAALAVTPLAGSAATVPQVPGHIGKPISIPTVTVPAVTVPAVSTPVATTPAVTTPAVTTPPVTVTTPPASVTTPSVQVHAPTVHVPSVTVPGVTTPTASTPPVSTPPVSTPPVSTLAPSTGSSAGPSGRATGSSTSGAGASSNSSLTGSGSGAAGARGGSGAARHGAKRSSSKAGSTNAATENRQLQKLVTRLHGCLGSLTPQSRRLLSLRAGLNGAPRSAGAVAGLLHVSPAREGLLEQLSLVELQSSASSGCAGAPATSTSSSQPIGDQLTPSAPWLPIATAGSPPAAKGASSSAAPASARGSSRNHSRSVISSVPAANRRIERASTGSHGLPAGAIALFAALLLGLSLLVLPATRRQLLQPSRGSGRPPRAPVAPTQTAAVSSQAAITAKPPGSSTVAPIAEASAGVAAARWVPRSSTAPEPTGDPDPQPKPESHDPIGQPEPEVAPAPEVPAPEAKARAHGDPAAVGSTSGGDWAREHATQAALAVTVIAGGAVRLLTRGRRSRRGRR